MCFAEHPLCVAEGAPLDFHLIWALQWDHVYTSNYFLALLGLLAASLAACSATRQWPMVKVAKRCASTCLLCANCHHAANTERMLTESATCRWKFAKSAKAVAALGSEENSVTLPDARAADLGLLLKQKSYQVFLKNGSLYAFKGIAGRFAPIGVHVSMLLIIAGGGTHMLPSHPTLSCNMYRPI